MKAKEYLQQLNRISVIINQKTEEKEALRDSLTSISSPDFSRERVQGGDLPGDAGFAKKVIRLISLEKEIDEKINGFINLKCKIIEQIQGLQNANHIKILYKRYVECKSLGLISVEMNYSYQYTKELHVYALHEFESTYPNLR